jgi:RNA-directed DNA polymerase
MKRVGYLLERIAEPENLREAFLRASRAKSDRADVQAFRENLRAHLAEMRDQILSGEVPVGGYRQFRVYDPKERVITVAPFAQRVLHHAILLVCEPYLENKLVPWTYACRKGKGRLAALDAAAGHCRKQAWYLKLDIRKYFDSVPHGPLLERLHGIFKDVAVLALWERIIRSHEAVPGRGLPIGNLTSQHLANLYLGGLDRFIEREARFTRFGAVRYMDDSVVWGKTRAELEDLRTRLREFVPLELGLELKQERIGRVESGVPFLGCTLHARHRELNRRSRQRFQKRIDRIDQLLAEHRITELRAQQRATAMGAYAKSASSLRFRRNALQSHFRASAMDWTEPPTAASAGVAGTTMRTTALSPIVTTTTTRTTATTTSASVWPAAPEGFPGGKLFPEPAAVPFR